MNEYQLSCSFENFQQTVKAQIAKFDLLQHRTIAGVEELQTAKQERRDCYKETITLLNSCFREPDNELVRDFTETQVGGFMIAGAKKSTEAEIKEFRESCVTYGRALESVLLYGSLSDVMQRPDEVDLDERARMTVEDRQLFILKKLNEANNGAYLDVKWILEANGVKLRHYNEVSELVKELSDIGYVEILGVMSGVMASITMQGVKFIENNGKNAFVDEEYSDGGYEQMCERMDEVMNYLKKAGVEREILFEELQELKELYAKLGKKNWRQLALGKLADLALAKVVENDTISFIYEKLTGEHLKLLS